MPCTVTVTTSHSGSHPHSRTRHAGAGPAVALWSLKLARAYYASPLGAAAAACLQHAQQSPRGSGSSDELAWTPLLQPVFLDSLAALLDGVWQRHGLLPSAGAAAAAGTACAAASAVPAMPGTSALERFIASGRLAPRSSALPDADARWSQRLFGACLAMGDVPYAEELAPAVAQLREALRALPPQLLAASAGSIGGGAALATPLLAMLLPQAPPSAVAMISRAVQG